MIGLNTPQIGTALPAGVHAPEAVRTLAIPSRRCRRCHRALRDPKSVAMGLGPVCARKAARDEDEDSQARLEPTISDPALARESMARVARWLAKTGAKCSCGSELSGVESFDHDGGFAVPGYGRRQWIYSHCEACERDFALGKLRFTEDTFMSVGENNTHKEARAA